MHVCVHVCAFCVRGVCTVQYRRERIQVWCRDSGLVSDTLRDQSQHAVDIYLPAANHSVSQDTHAHTQNSDREYQRCIFCFFLSCICRPIALTVRMLLAPRVSAVAIWGGHGARYIPR